MKPVMLIDTYEMASWRKELGDTVLTDRAAYFTLLQLTLTHSRLTPGKHKLRAEQKQSLKGRNRTESSLEKKKCIATVPCAIAGCGGRKGREQKGKQCIHPKSLLNTSTL